jgi:hypothetical protein
MLQCFRCGEVETLRKRPSPLLPTAHGPFEDRARELGYTDGTCVLVRGVGWILIGFWCSLRSFQVRSWGLPANLRTDLSFAAIRPYRAALPGGRMSFIPGGVRMTRYSIPPPRCMCILAAVQCVRCVSEHQPRAPPALGCDRQGPQQSAAQVPPPQLTVGTVQQNASVLLRVTSSHAALIPYLSKHRVPAFGTLPGPA